MALSVGVRVGPYEVLAALGAGGMGEVYRARDPRLSREVALKVLPSSFAKDEERLRRFEREAKAAGALNHPNLLSVFDVGTHDGSPYIVSELLEGSSLRTLLSGSGLPLRKALDHAVQIACGLAAAHDQGIVHRDLKPENIVVTRDGRAKILDFGLAKLSRPSEGFRAETGAPTVSSPTTPGTVLGTVGYMSPEQVQGLPADHRSDIFSFGAVLYEMVSGKRAFKGATAVETMNAILKEDPPELAEASRTVSPAVERIVRRCLEKNPEERFRSAHDLAFALEATSGVSTPHGPGRAVAAARPRRWLGAVLALLTLTALAALAYLLGIRQGEKPIPSWTRLTFRRGGIGHARFGPDGQAVVYGAAWDDTLIRLFSGRTDSPESRPLDLPAADILAISAKGEMALAIGRRIDTPGASVGGVLARVPLAGGAPREVLEAAEAADWSPDGTELAVIRRVAGRRRLEFPVGRVVQEGDYIFSPRIAPTGALVAFIDGDKHAVCVADRAGRTRVLATSQQTYSLAWSAKGDEVWYIEGNDLRGATLSGRSRLLTRFPPPSWPRIEDVRSDGRVLMTLTESRTGIVALPPGEARERDLSWFGHSYAAGLSPDGGTLLFADDDGVYLRKTNGPSAVRLGDGVALALSPDTKWALTSRGPSEVALVPTGPGESRTLSGEGVEYFDGEGSAAWLPDARSFLVVGREAGRPWRVYVQDIGGGQPRPVTPEGIAPQWPRVLGETIAPDGQRVAVVGPARRIGLYSIEGGEAQSVPGPLEPGDLKQWTPDGRSLYVTEVEEGRIRVLRRDLATGRREPWKEIAPADPSGVFRLDARLTPEGRSYVYTFYRGLANLYVVDGLR